MSTETKNEWGTRKCFTKFLPPVLVVALIGFVLIKFNAKPLELGENGAFNWEYVWLTLVFWYIVFSYRFWNSIPDNQHGSLQLFGKPIGNVGSGAPFAPLGIISIKTISKVTMQREFPAEPELVFRGELKARELLPDGMKPPIRIPFSENISEEKAKRLFGYVDETNPGSFTVVAPTSGEQVTFVADTTGDPKYDGLTARVTGEPSVIVRLQVDDPSRFFQTIGGEPQVFQQIEDEIVTKLNEYYTRMSVAQALMNQRWMSIVLYLAVKARLEEHGESRDWGAKLETVQVKYINLSHGLNDSIDDAAQAPFRKRQVIIAAEGEKEKRILEGVGEAKASREKEKQTLEGRAAGIKRLANDLEVTGSEALSSEVARTIGEGGNTVVVGTDGFKEVAGIAAAFGRKKKPVTEDSAENEGDRS